MNPQAVLIEAQRLIAKEVSDTSGKSSNGKNKLSNHSKAGICKPHPAIHSIVFIKGWFPFLFSEHKPHQGWSSAESWGGICVIGRGAGRVWFPHKANSTKGVWPHSSALPVLKFNLISLRAAWKETQQEVLVLLSPSLWAVWFSEIIAWGRGRLGTGSQPSLWHKNVVISAFKEANWSLVNSGPDHQGLGGANLLKCWLLFDF